VAAGSGIAPIFSIASTVLEREPQSSVVLLYGNRTVADIMFLEELEDLKNLYPDRFALYHVLSREEQEVPLLHGRIDGERFRAFLDELVRAHDVDEWFLCGPHSMIEAVKTVLAERGVDARRVHAELYHTESVALARDRGAGETVAPSGETSRVDIVLDGRRSSFTMSRAGERVLDAALRVRSDAPYACKGGVCGTCRAKLLEGTVEMEHTYALEQSEIDDGYVLACQSHPTSERLVLDFDE
jgi:ring-1,2-phenylacetyl-CoA epoxidase subunit PaaE